MNRRRFLAGVAATFAAAPIVPTLAAAWNPLAIADVVTPDIFAPYAAKTVTDYICNSVAQEWARQIETYFVTRVDWGLPCP